MRLLPRGGRSVRLANGHVMTAAAAAAGSHSPHLALIGDLVRIELGLGDPAGWRLAAPQPAFIKGAALDHPQ